MDGLLAVDGRRVATSLGRRLRLTDFSSALTGPRIVEVWLPPNYERGAEPCRVLYVPEGQNIFDNPATPSGGLGVDRVLGGLITDGTLPPTIVVAVWSRDDRSREFLPDAPFLTVAPDIQDDYQALIGGGPAGDRFSDFLATELKPYIDGRFRTRSGPDGTLLLGVSMAAIANLYTLMRYPGMFGGAACISTHWLHVSHFPWVQTGDPRMSIIAAAFLRHMRDRLPAAGSHRFYFDLGTAGVDVVNPTLQDFVDGLMAERGYRQGRDWLTRVFPGELHNELAWRRRVAWPLRFILGDVAGAGGMTKGAGVATRPLDRMP